MVNRYYKKSKVKKIFKAKQIFHRHRAKMPFGRKIRQLINLQKLANRIKSETGREKGRVWQI